ncbi:MAG TPA: hypothetical protein VGP58_07235 [Pyrinomonadaceae bacterium]|nr:hypothetical protein [Pyrinomonadaceae bacterium]
MNISEQRECELRRASVFSFLLFGLIFLTASEVFAQYCTGTTRYVVRDEAGKILTGENLKKLTVKSINGIPLKLRQAASETGLNYYEAEFVRGYYQDNIPKEFRRETRIILEKNNPLIFGIYSPTVCGKVGDLTLEYGGKQMRLIFDIGEHNTSYEIDSPPFWEGTFHLASLKCKDGAKPPLIDNNNTGKCPVSADSWKSAGNDWARHLVWNEMWDGRNARRVDCKNKKLEVITNHKDWTAAWEIYRGVGRSNPLPAIDFKTEVVLIVYLPKAPPSLGYDSIVVDKKGDLTFRPPPPRSYDPNRCSVLLLEIYRSGIKSIEGKPLPPPSPKVCFECVVRGFAILNLDEEFNLRTL